MEIRNTWKERFINLNKLIETEEDIGKAIIAEGTAGLGQDILVNQLIATSLRRGFKTVIATATKTRSQIILELSRFGIDIRTIEENLFLVTTIPEQHEKVKVVEMEKIFTISSAVRDMFGICKMCVLEIVKPLSIFEDPKIVIKFVYELIKESKKAKTTLIIPLDTGIVDTRTLSTIEDISDVIIEMRESIRGFKVVRGIRCKKALFHTPTPFYEYKITETSIRVGGKLE